jgi:serine/threonine protein kinase/Tol biopolymer transport system component
MKVMSQIRSLIWRTPTICPAKTWLTLIFRRRQQIRPHVVTVPPKRRYGFSCRRGHPFNTIALLLPLVHGSRLGPYEVLSALGAGGMGEVYRARDSRLNRDVAIKILLPVVAGDPDRLARFEREAQVLASLNHPNIAHIHGVEEADGVTALVLELVEGEDLAQRIARGPVPLDEALPIARQIAEALEAAHERGIIHRDLKPANIKIRPDGTVKVLDFGLAKAVDRSDGSGVNAMNSPTLSIHSTQAGIILGTAAYMSPEQAAGKPIDKRSDLWSFGVVLMEMLTGRPVFDGETVSHVLASVLKSDPQWTSLPAGTPAPLHRLLRRCLEKDRKRRLADAADARLEIEEASIAPEGVESAGPASVSVSRSASAGPLTWLLAASTVALAITVVVLWAPWRPRTAPISTALRYTPLSFEQGGQTAAVWSPDGKAVAFGARPTIAGAMQVYVRYLDSPVATQVTHVETGGTPTDWTTGGRIVFSTSGTTPKLWTVSPVGGEPELVQVIDRPFGTSMSRDGKTLAWFHQGADGMWGIGISSPPGAPGKPYQPAPFAIRSYSNAPGVKFSPDGKQMLFVPYIRGANEAWVLPYPADPARPPRRILTDIPMNRGSPTFSWMPDNRHVVMSTTTDESPEQLYVLDTISGAFNVLSSGTRAQRFPAVSPDGTKLTLMEGWQDFDIVSVDLATASVTPVLATQRSEHMPAWAAREAALVYVTDRNGAPEVWLQKRGQPDRPIVTPRDFPPGTTQFFMGPILSPDATRVIYTRKGRDEVPKLWMSAVAGGQPVRLVKSAADSEYAGSWSPDGKWFVYWSVPEGAASLNKVKTTGDAQSEVVKATTRGSSWVPVWSPAGDWILHADDGAKLVSPDGKLSRDLSASAGSGWAFSADGQTVYGIRSPVPGRPELFSLSIDGKSDKTIGALGLGNAPASPLSPSMRLTLSPDGKSLTYATVKITSNLWLAEGLRVPGSR